MINVILCWDNFFGFIFTCDYYYILLVAIWKEITSHLVVGNFKTTELNFFWIENKEKTCKKAC